jgi:KTSC domain
MRAAPVSIMFSLAVLICWLNTAGATEPANITSHIRRESLSSSALATAGYSKRQHILEIEFCNGAIYRYLDVPPSIYRDFLSAKSQARYYDWNIKGRYASLRLRPARLQTDR